MEKLSAMGRDVLSRATDFAAKRTLCGSLAFNSGVVILGSLASICLLPSHPAMSQSRTFNGVQVSQKFSPNSEMAELIKQSTTKRFRNSTGRIVRLGKWVIVPGAKDNYSTYETQMLFEMKFHSVILLAGTTSDSPKLLSYRVDCAKNKMRQSGYRVFSSSGDRVTRQSVEAPLVAPFNEYAQSLVNEVCKLEIG